MWALAHLAARADCNDSINLQKEKIVQSAKSGTEPQDFDQTSSPGKSELASPYTIRPCGQPLDCLMCLML